MATCTISFILLFIYLYAYFFSYWWASVVPALFYLSQVTAIVVVMQAVITLPFLGFLHASNSSYWLLFENRGVSTSLCLVLVYVGQRLLTVGSDGAISFLCKLLDLKCSTF